MVGYQKNIYANDEKKIWNLVIDLHDFKFLEKFEVISTAVAKTTISSTEYYKLNRVCIEILWILHCDRLYGRFDGRLTAC